MATFTTVQKHRLSWQAPQTAAVGAPESDFIFSDGVDFLFSDTTDFVFKEATSERSPTVWTGLTKNR